MTTLKIYVPRLNDELCDAYQLARIWRQVDAAGDGAEVVFDFTHCDFLRPNAVVFLGGLARMIHYRGGRARFAVVTMQDKLKMNLMQSGFAHAMGADARPWQGHAIPYQEHIEQDEDAIVESLKRDWLGRGWISVSDALASAIAGQMWEIFANAFEHSETPVGVYSCGQYLPKRRELLLAVADFGVGIPSNVRLRLNQACPGGDAMRRAFALGFTTSRREGPRGVGLDLLKEFVQKNHGLMLVFSHDGYAKIDAQGERYENLEPFFEGTLVQIRLHCDDKRYMLSKEIDTSPFF